MKKGLERRVKALQRRNSQGHVVLLFFLLIGILGIALVARYYLFAPVQLQDSSMAPKFKEKSIHWMCKFPQCVAKVKEKDIIWIALKNGETMVRNVIALPGDSIEITDKGHVRTPYRNYKWNDESYFIQSRKVYIPKKGDTLYFDQLNDIEQDYVISYLTSHGIPVSVQTTLWQGDHEMNLERVGSTKIANRQVSLKEINFLPWQDRYLIELQIRHSEPGNAPIKLKRQLFIDRTPKALPVDSMAVADSVAAADSTLQGDSTARQDTIIKKPAPPDTTVHHQKPVGDPLNQIVIEDDCYYVTCEKPSNCPDSREMGFFTQEDFIGRYIAWPDRIKKKVVSPVRRIIEKAVDKILDLFISETPTEDPSQKAPQKIELDTPPVEKGTPQDSLKNIKPNKK